MVLKLSYNDRLFLKSLRIDSEPDVMMPGRTIQPMYISQKEAKLIIQKFGVLNLETYSQYHGLK